MIAVELGDSGSTDPVCRNRSVFWVIEPGVRSRKVREHPDDKSKNLRCS